MKKVSIILAFLLPLLSFGAKYTPIENGRLQTPLDANRKAITNVPSITFTNGVTFYGVAGSSGILTNEVEDLIRLHNETNTAHSSLFEGKADIAALENYLPLSALATNKTLRIFDPSDVSHFIDGAGNQYRIVTSTNYSISFSTPAYGEPSYAFPYPSGTGSFPFSPTNSWTGYFMEDGGAYMSFEGESGTFEDDRGWAPSNLTFPQLLTMYGNMSYGTGIVSQVISIATNLIDTVSFSSSLSRYLTNEADRVSLRAWHYGSSDIVESPASWFTFNAEWQTITAYVNPANGADVVIPWAIDGVEVKWIGSRAFLGASINSVIAPKTLTSLDPDAFKNCTMKTAVFPSVSYIDEQALDNCSLLNSITWGSDAPAVEELEYLFEDSNIVTNYVNSLTAVGWSDTFGGRPVIRMGIKPGSITLGGVARSTWPEAGGITNNQSGATLGDLYVSNVFSVASSTVTNKAVMSPLGSNNVAKVWQGTYSNYVALVDKTNDTTYIITDDLQYDTVGIYSEKFDYTSIYPTTTVQLVQEKGTYVVNMTTNCTVTIDTNNVNLVNKIVNATLVLAFGNTNVLSPTFTSLFDWGGYVPEFSVTGRYEFALTMIGDGKVRIKQTYPTVYECKDGWSYARGGNTPTSPLLWNEAISTSITNSFVTLGGLCNLVNPSILEIDYYIYVTNEVTNPLTIKIGYGKVAEFPHANSVSISTNVFLGSAQITRKYYSPSIPKTSDAYAVPYMQFYLLKTGPRFYIVGIRSRFANENEVKAYNAGKRDW